MSKPLIGLLISVYLSKNVINAYDRLHIGLTKPMLDKFKYVEN